MSKFAKITKAEADILGRMYLGNHHAFDPYVGEQMDGTYIVSETMIDILKKAKLLKGIELDKKPTKNYEELNFKPSS